MHTRICVSEKITLKECVELVGNEISVHMGLYFP